MASIQDVRLVLVESDFGGSARVRYTLRGSPDDVERQQRYRERVELIGVDEGAGEDGVNELLRGGGLAFTRPMTFESTAPLERSRVEQFSFDELDEDWGLSGQVITLGDTGQVLRLPNMDEIRARVTLTQISGKSITARSEIRRRGGFLIPGWL